MAVRGGLAWGAHVVVLAWAGSWLCGCPAAGDAAGGRYGMAGNAHAIPGAPTGGTDQGGGTAGIGMPTGTGGSGGGSSTEPMQQPPVGSGGTGVPQTMTGGSGGMVGPAPAAVFDAGTDPARNQVKAGQVCTRLAQIQCAGEAFCCTNPGRERAACEQAQQNLCAMQGYLDAISLNRISGFDETSAASAFTMIEQLASQCDPTIAAFATSPAGLLGMFKGTVAANGSCSPGVALDNATAAASLASCMNNATVACLPQSSLVWMCAPRGAAGALCFTDVNCQDGLYCPNPNNEIGTKKCTARKAVGTPCTTPNECLSLYCQGGACVDATPQAAYCLSVK